MAGVLLPAGDARAQSALPNVTKSPLSTTGEKLNSFEDITSYNNFYEFGTDKERSRPARAQLQAAAVDGEVEGEVGKPGDYHARGLCSSASRSRSASIACAASKRGRW